VLELDGRQVQFWLCSANHTICYY